MNTREVVLIIFPERIKQNIDYFSESQIKVNKYTIVVLNLSGRLEEVVSLDE